MDEWIVWFDQVGMQDVAHVGGKNASLGEMISQLASTGIRVPNGFATTASAYERFLSDNALHDLIESTLTHLDVNDIDSLTRAGQTLRERILSTPLPAGLEQAIRQAYAELENQTQTACPVAVRSSATAEDLPEASFAGQQESYLNVCGIEDVLTSVNRVFASLFNDRAIAYRVHNGFVHADVSLSAGVQMMVRSDLACSGVMFTLDTESGFPDVVFVTSSWGLGEAVVQGAVNPDEFYVFKRNIEAKRPAILRRTLGSKMTKMVFAEPGQSEDFTTTIDVEKSLQSVFSLSDSDVELLARYAIDIERHYQRPMDIEWGKDGLSGELFILQARPETVRSRECAQVLERYQLENHGEVICTGRSIGTKIGSGIARVVQSIAQMDQVGTGDVLVADMTDPDWEPILARASAIVTNRGGRTCHAAIIARELGIPAVVGTTHATQSIASGQNVTVSCAQGETGFIYDGLADFSVNRVNLEGMPAIDVKLSMNVANPDRAFSFASIPNEGVGLARLEFIINRMVGIHPKALLGYGDLPMDLRDKIDERIAGYPDPVTFYVDKVTEGVATIAAAFYPKPVIVRLSDFKSNEYFNLLGGDLFEPNEENPMIGFRGASRYLAETFQPCFELECRAMRKVREDMDLTNLQLMVPFVRTINEAQAVIALLSRFGLRRGDSGLKVVMMCELPSNALLAKEFLEHFDGFSIGSNDLTQLTLGLDRDSSLVAAQFDERDDAVKQLLSMAIRACNDAGKYVGICGQGPSDHEDFANWLVKEGIQSMSLNPDSVVSTWLSLAKMAKS